jgi:diguanylate cyclase (GGDEF)-like protein
VLGFYLGVPNRQLYKAIPALLLTIISFYSLFGPENTSLQAITKPTLVANISSLIVMNVIGFLTSLRIELHRHQQYLIQKTMMDGRAQLKEIANTDILTGMLNRRSFFETADIQFDRFKRYKETFSFVIADIDNLKAINDTYGHPAGDHSIGLLTGTIHDGKRSSDSVGRLAGDEIGVLLPNTNANQAREVITRIKDMLAETIVESPSKQQFQVRFSAGITEVRATDETFDEIYRRADKALLRAKNLGKNRIEQA